MKDTIMKIIISVLIIVIFILGGKILYNNYTLTAERYNENVLNFSVELMKGNKNIDNINMTDFPEEVKEAMIEYYNSKFYTMDEEIILGIDLTNIDSVILEINDIEKKATVDGVFDYSVYEQYIQTAISERYENTVVDVDNIIMWEYYYESFDRSKKDLNEFVVKDGKLSVRAGDLIFVDGTCRKYYNGFPIDIYRDTLDKLFISEIRESEKYQSISISRTEVGEKEIVYILRDYLGNGYSFICRYKHNKIIDIIF